MSLVNDLLRDLEARAEKLPEIAAIAPAARKTRASGGSKILLSSGVLCSVLLAGYWFGQQSGEAPALSSPPPADIDVVTSPPFTTVDKPVTTTSTPAMGNSHGTVAIGPAAVESETHGQADKIELLLAEADAALAGDRLTQPVDDNAFSRYRLVLSLDPNNRAAVTGITRIVERYLQLRQAALSNGDGMRADRYLSKARWIGQLFPDLGPVVAASIATAATQASQTKTKAPEASVAESPAVVANVQPSERYRTEQRLAQARELMEAGQWREAKTLLAALLEIPTAADDARHMLFDIDLATGDWDQARTLLEHWSELPRAEHRLLQARLLVERGQFSDALALLNGDLPATASAADYHALRAALNHQLGDFITAATIYRELLAYTPDNASYWLGLAVSLDAANDKFGALGAFRHARLYGEPSAEVRPYIEQRIAALSN